MNISNDHVVIDREMRVRMQKDERAHPKRRPLPCRHYPTRYL
jgi:hypothetical protein